jgi:hypothetical protein
MKCKCGKNIRKNKTGMCISCFNKSRIGSGKISDRLTRKCPKCGETINHKNKYDRNRLEKQGALCLSCRRLGKKQSEETKKKISKANIGRKMTKEQIKRMVENRSYVVSEETREILRIRKIEYMERNGTLIWPNFNELACEYFDWLNKFNGWNGHHAKNGGEKRIGRFWVDYYEPEHNIIIEWDEDKHYDENGNLKQEDIERQTTIIKKTGCDFYRIRQIDFEIYKVEL